MNAEELKANRQAKHIIEQVFRGLKDFDEAHSQALDLLQPWMEGDSPSIITLINVAAVHSNAGDRKQAFVLLERVLESEPTIAQAYYNFAVVLMNDRGQSEAMDFFAVSNQYPKHPDVIEAYFDPHGH